MSFSDSLLEAFSVYGAPKLTLALAVALLGVAFLVGRFTPNKRRKLARAVVFFGLSLLVALAGVGVGATGGHAAGAERLDAVASLFRLFCTVDLCALCLFEIVLLRLHLSIPYIAQELTVGIAYSAATLMLFQRLGFNLAGLLATSAVVTLVLGLSLQATLGNILGGVALQMDGSIHVGDWVRMEAKTEGLVREIRWRHTVIETRNGDTLIVPNATLLQQTILILGKRAGEAFPHRMWVYFDVDFRYLPERVNEIVERALRTISLPHVAETPEPDCICLGFAQEGHLSAAHYGVRYWLTDIARDDPTNSVILTRIYTALAREGIPLAMPAQHMFVTRESTKWIAHKNEAQIAQRVELLNGIEIFNPMTHPEKELLAKRCRPAPFVCGEVITRQGAEAHWLYILVSGSVKIQAKRPNGEELVIASVKAPSVFGEMGLMTGAPRLATVIATSAAECFRLDKEDFKEILLARPEISHELSKTLAKRRVELESLYDHSNLDDEQRESRIHEEGNQILLSIERFFGLRSD